MTAAERALAGAVSEVADFMRKRGLTLDDLVAIVGQDLNGKLAEKARRVEACWGLMAKLGVKYADLEHSEQSRAELNVARGFFASH